MTTGISSATRATLTLALSLLLPHSAGAVANLVSDQALFQAQTESLTTVRFDSLVEPPDTFAGLGIPLEHRGASFSAPVNLTATSPAFSAGYDYGLGTVLTAFGVSGNFVDSSNNSFQIGFTLDTLPSAVGFFVANGFAGRGLPGSFSITVVTESLPDDEPGSEFSFFLIDADASGSAIFVGFLADRGITSIKVDNDTPAQDYLQITSPTSGSPFTNLGSFQYGNAVVVPVPAGLVLLAAPLLSLAGRRRPG